MKALQLAGATDAKGRWIGGNMIVVQTGDEIDRGDDDRRVIDLFERLRTEAQAAGGAVYPLSGNHETMNVYLDFRYVTDGSFMTSAACHNPSLGYMAFTARAVDHAVSELKKNNI